MTGNKVLHDTNIIIDLFRGEVLIAQKLKQQSSVFVPSIALGEIYTGIFRNPKRDKQILKLNEFLEQTSLISIDKITTEYYGSISALLYKKGKPIPTNDIWIAALALQHDITLVSRDNHFNEIDNLNVARW